MGNFLTEISLCGGFNFVQTSEGYMDLIGFVRVLGVMVCLMLWGVKVCVIKV